MASIKVRGSKLYIRYTILGNTKDKATGLEDNPKNRKYVEKVIIPKLEERMANGYYTKKNKVADYARIYLGHKEALKTYSEYEVRVKSILKHFGSREISDIKLSEIDSWVDSFQCSPKTVKKYVGDFKGIYYYAVRDEVVATNIFDKVKLQSHKKTEINPFSQSDINKLLSETRDNLNSFFGIAFFTGMRAGEIIALQERDIDFDKMTISVRRNITKGVLTTPKTALSIRTIPIFYDCIPYLRRQIKEAKNARSLFLFHTENGERLKDANSMNALRYLREKGYKNRVHDTRHTFITNMLNSGVVRITDLAQIVGHANVQMIMTVYAKFIKGEELKIDRSISLYKDEGTVKGTIETLSDNFSKNSV